MTPLNMHPSLLGVLILSLCLDVYLNVTVLAFPEISTLGKKHDHLTHLTQTSLKDIQIGMTCHPMGNVSE